MREKLDRNGLNELFNQFNKNSKTKNLTDERLKVCKSIFRKFSTFLLGHEITLMGELKSQEFIFEHENLLEWTIKGLLVYFGRNVNFNP